MGIGLSYLLINLSGKTPLTIIHCAYYRSSVLRERIGVYYSCIGLGLHVLLGLPCKSAIKILIFLIWRSPRNANSTLLLKPCLIK